MPDIAVVATGVPAGGAGGSGDGGAGGGGTGVATEIDPGVGGAEGSGGEGGEGGAEGAGDGESTEGTGEGGGEGESVEGAGEGEGTEDPDEFSQDGRRVDDKTRKALAQVKKVDPAAAKTLADTYHRAQRIIKDTGSKTLSEAVNKVSAMAATMDSIGGEEGLTEMQSKISDYDSEITQFAKGDTGLIQSLWEGNPEGLELSTTASLNFIAGKDADAFDRVLLPPMVARLERAGMFTTVEQIANFVKEGKGQEAYDLTLKLSRWLANAKTYQKNQLEMKEKKNPEQEALETRRRELDQRESEIYNNRIGVDVNKLNNSVMSKTVEPFFKEMKLPEQGRKKFVDGLQSEIWSMMKSDKVFQRQAAAIKNKGDAERTTQFVHDKFRELLPEAFRNYRNQLYPNYARMATKKAPAPAAGATGTKTQTGAAPVKVNHVAGTRPKFSDVSWASEGGKTTDIDWIRGKAFLKDGREVKFDPNSPPNRL